MTDSPTRIIDTPVSSSASAHSHHGGRVDIVRAVIARLLSRTLSARGSDLSQRPDGSDFLTDMISDGAIAEVVGQPWGSMWDDIMEVLVAFLPIHETTARFVLHQALSRAERGGVPQSETVSVDILPIRTAQMLPIAFVHEARARMVEFAGRHFGEPPDWADLLVDYVIGTDVGYLSDKTDQAAVRILADAYELEGEAWVLCALSIWLRPDIQVPAVELMRRHLVNFCRMPEISVDIFLRFARPYLDESYARCFVRFMRGRTD